MELNMIVEVPKGSRNKYEFDPTVGRIRLNRMLFTSTRYPTDYGYIPDTLAEDGDPLDAMVLLDEPTFPGCQIHVRSVGVFWMRDEEGPDAKILTVPASDPRFADINDLVDIPDHQLGEIRHFFEVYKDLEPGKDTDVRGWQDRTAADEEIHRSIQRGKTHPYPQSPALAAPCNRGSRSRAGDSLRKDLQSGAHRGARGARGARDNQ